MKISYFLIITLLVGILSGCAPRIESNFNAVANGEPDQIPVAADSKTATTSNQQDVEITESEVPLKPVKEEALVPKPTEMPEAGPEAVIPQKLDSEMVFVSQAPYAVWDQLHEEACEEASMIMVKKYFSKESLSAHIMEQEILDLVEWEQTQGYQIDLTAQETATILRDYFTLSAEVITDVNVERIKQELVAGKLIIVPAAGRELGNPYFQTPGPIYHMLIIKGFDDNTQEFITNDPGTRRGKDFRYSYQRLLSAIHDWDHELAKGGMTDEEISQGRKVIILVSN
ncbi:MAG: C39 family peptidase [Candidatus Buchananbacteria bacterium]|nr:C39 family peptidase [Candidatus Buchananbacteria bacterium]